MIAFRLAFKVSSLTELWFGNAPLYGNFSTSFSALLHSRTISQSHHFADVLFRRGGMFGLRTPQQAFSALHTCLETQQEPCFLFVLHKFLPFILSHSDVRYRPSNRTYTAIFVRSCSRLYGTQTKNLSIIACQLRKGDANKRKGVSERASPCGGSVKLWRNKKDVESATSHESVITQRY